jgi:glycosyltransferase involved in cell wall biosynthesis
MPARFVLFHGSLQAKKGSLVLADALVEIMSEQPDLHAVFIGRDLKVPGLGSMADLIQGKLAAFPERVHVVGVIDQSVAFQYLEKAEWVILPSIMDNLPNAMLEAMWMAKPVLVTRRSGTDDLIVDGESGLVVEPGDAAALRAGIRRALAMSRAEQESLGRRARVAVEQACDLDRAAAEFERSLAAAGSSHKPASAPMVAMRRRWLQIRWLIQLIRYIQSGPTLQERRALEILAGRFLPGYTIRYP